MCRQVPGLHVLGLCLLDLDTNFAQRRGRQALSRMQKPLLRDPEKERKHSTDRLDYDRIVGWRLKKQQTLRCVECQRQILRDVILGICQKKVPVCLLGLLLDIGINAKQEQL
jgi:hypothetical protein